VQRSFLPTFHGNGFVTAETFYFLWFMFSTATFVLAIQWCYLRMSQYSAAATALWSMWTFLGGGLWFCLGVTVAEMMIVFIPFSLNMGLGIMYTWQMRWIYDGQSERAGESEKLDFSGL
jgi:hypothetical protein